MRNGKKRARTNAARSQQAQSFEPLESRLMLAASSRSVFDVRSVPTYRPTTTVLTDYRSGPLANMGGQLGQLYVDYRRFRNSGGSETNFHPNQDLFVYRGSSVAVTIRGRSVENLTSTVRSLGGEIIYRSNQYKVAQAWMPITQLHSLATTSDVLTVNPVYGSKLGQQGNANNQADETQRADEVRSVFGLDGSGVKVGVISDSVNLVGTGIPGSVATGNLPSDGVQVIDDAELFMGPTDEGRGMLELVHDIAPAAELAFATANPTQLAFANNIRSLSAAGSDVIVDDIIYFDEPMFQPGVIDLAIQDVVENGGVYVSIAHNFADQGYEAPARWVTIGRNRFIDFDPGPDIDTRMRVEINAGTAFLQWDNPYNGVVGSATSDLDVYFYDPNNPQRIIASSTLNNLASGIPVEALGIRSGRFDMEIRLAAHISGEPLPTRFKIAGTFDLQSTEYSDGIRSGTWGHCASPYSISVGAVQFSSVPPYASENETIINEDFSGQGPVTHVFDADGNRLPELLTLNKPDISGVDGINTSFFGEPDTGPNSPPTGPDDDVLPNFFGTSAAAPNVAAVVALIKQAAPGATQEEILDAFKATARPLNGAAIGEYDPQGGFGLIDALAAVEQFVTQPTVQIEAVSPDPRVAPVDQIEITFSQQVSGFGLDDLTLSVDGGPNLLTGANELTTSDGGRTWQLTNLTDITTVPGVYTLRIFTDAGIVNTVGLPLTVGDVEQFEVLPPPSRPEAPSNLLSKTLNDTSIRLRWTDNSDIENGFTIQRADDVRFTDRTKTFQVSANTTVFTDEGLVPGKTYYYRIRARNDFSGISSWSNIVTSTTLSPGEIILDNESSGRVTVSGAWETLSDVPGFFGSSYLDDMNSGKGTKTVRYTPNFEATADYFVYARWPRAVGNATNVPIDIYTMNGKKRVVVNQRDTGGGGWVLLGKFRFERGTAGFVIVRTDGTNGHVIADGMRFTSATGGVVNPPV